MNSFKFNITIVLSIIFVLLIVFNVTQYQKIKDLKRQQQFDYQNQLTLKDSLKFEKKKNGDLQVSIAAFVASEQQLKELNKNLWLQVKQQEGKVVFLNRAIVQLRQDSVDLRKALNEAEKIIEKIRKINDSTYSAGWTLPFKYDSTNFDIFSGKTYIGVISKDPLELAHIDTQLTNRITQIDLIWGQEVINNQLRVFVRSKYPGFTVKSMEGVMIDPNTNSYIKGLMKKDKWFTGFGLGVAISPGFNLVTGKYGLIIGPSFHYTIYSF